MKIRFLIGEAFQAIRGNWLRSVLTIVGIVVGIFSVTAMLALGEGVSANIMDRFSAFTQGDLTVSGEIQVRDLTWIQEQKYVDQSVATAGISGTAVVAFGTSFSPQIQTALGDYQAVQSYTLVSGEAFDWQRADYDEAVAVVSDGFADRVKEETGQAVLDQEITINNQKFRVIGVIKSSSMNFTRGDGLLLVPYQVAIGSLTSNKNFSSVAVVLKESSYYEIAGQHILQALNASRQLAPDSKEVFSVETAKAFIETAEETTAMMSLFLGLIGGIALFVGGIGTMNMMLTTVTERTKEIGLRKAVGARDQDILWQILVESVVLTSSGGAIGILLSLLAGRVANQLLADSEVISIIVSMQVIMLAALVAFLVGIVFGVYPARKASKLQPVEALRMD